MAWQTDCLTRSVGRIVPQRGELVGEFRVLHLLERLTQSVPSTIMCSTKPPIGPVRRNCAMERSFQYVLPAGARASAPPAGASVRCLAAAAAGSLPVTTPVRQRLISDYNSDRSSRKVNEAYDN